MSHYFDNPNLFRNDNTVSINVAADDYIDPILGARGTVAILRSENSKLRLESERLSIDADIAKKAIEFVCDWFNGVQAPHVCNDSRMIVYSMLDGRCFYCGARLDDGWHIEHMVPKSRGGNSSSENIVPSCQKCNLTKSTRTSEEYRSFLADKVKREIVFFGELSIGSEHISTIALVAATVRSAWERR